MSWHGYILVTNLPPGWTQSEREKAWTALRGMGRQDHPIPAHNNHSRLRLDGKALIVEAEFADSEITRAAVVAMVANALGVQVSAVEVKIEYMVFGELKTDWGSSLVACREFIRNNQAEWEPA